VTRLIFTAEKNTLVAYPLPKIILRSFFPSRFDIVDFTRQYLVLQGSSRYNSTMESYFNKDFPEFLLRSFNFLELLDDLELILKSSEHFMLGPWLESAKALGTTEEEKALLEYNARIQVVDNLFSNNEHTPIYFFTSSNFIKIWFKEIFLL
jgi:hypothetical protein